MLFKRYGRTVESVETNFDSKALTEIGFRRDRRTSIDWDTFESDYELVETHELSAEAEGDVHDEVEQDMLDDLESQLETLLDSLQEDEILLVQSEQGVDHPKTRAEQKNVIVEGENRLYFYVRMRPPLRLGRYRKG